MMLLDEPGDFEMYTCPENGKNDNSDKLFTNVSFHPECNT